MKFNGVPDGHTHVLEYIREKKYTKCDNGIAWPMNVQASIHKSLHGREQKSLM